MKFSDMQQKCPWSGITLSGEPACMAYGECGADNCAIWFFMTMPSKLKKEKEHEDLHNM